MSELLTPERKEQILTPGEQREIRYYIRHKDEKDIDLAEIPSWLADLHKERDTLRFEIDELKVALRAARAALEMVEYTS